MNEYAIEVENLSKQYQIAHEKERYLTLRDRLAHPLQAIKQLRTRTENFFALNNVSFKVERGEIIGIVGPNGSGKSTLLKILSRITPPSQGQVKVIGRVASLLEVGTGFHPELTGRENIFLNGVILGMAKKDIAAKFEAIVDFAGVTKFLDTPVKRYSSGMYVRLAFAVAAFMETDILFVDEVLSVGDAEFQKKCLGKMGEMIKDQQRTILFVSHNLPAVAAICSRAIYLRDGRIVASGQVDRIISQYLSDFADKNDSAARQLTRRGPGKFSCLTNVELSAEDNQTVSIFKIGSAIKLLIEFELFEDVNNLEIGIFLHNTKGTHLSTLISTWEGLPTKFSAGKQRLVCEMPAFYGFPDKYLLSVWLEKRGEFVDQAADFVVSFEVVNDDVTGFAPDLSSPPNQGFYIKSRWYSRT